MTEPALVAGSYVPAATESDVLTYSRRHGGRACLVALNMDDAPKAVVFKEDVLGRILLSTHLDRCGEMVGRELDLRPDEGVIVDVSRSSRS